MSDKDVTSWFGKIFMGCGGGSPRIECSCGRLVYADSPYFEPGEREELDRLREQDPERHVYLGNDEYVVGYELFGAMCVDGCPCNRMARTEEMIWSERDRIGKYLQERVAGEIAALQSIPLPESSKG